MQETAKKNAPPPTQEPRGNHRGNAARGTPPTQKKKENATRPRKEAETTHHYRPQQTPTMTTNTDKTRHEKNTETAKLQAHPFSMKALRLEPDVAVKPKLIPVKLQKGKMGKLRCLALPLWKGQSTAPIQ